LRPYRTPASDPKKRLAWTSAAIDPLHSIPSPLDQGV
jgi:hypothetical protein